MVHLTLTGMSANRTRLELVDEEGTTYTLDVDASLKQTLRTTWHLDGTGRTESTMHTPDNADVSLRPRDIQARIRAGESAEEVAAAANTSLERIMTYAGPVLDERVHVAERAQSSSVRRRAGDTGARTLGEAVEQQMHAAEADHRSVVWDAWQREDRRWVLSAEFVTQQRSGTARFVFDPRGNYVTSDGEDAKWLVGEPMAPTLPVRDDLQEARVRRLGTSGPVEGELGTDAISLVSEDPPLPDPTSTPLVESTVDLSDTAARIRGTAPTQDQDQADAAADATESAPSVAEPVAKPVAEQLTLDNTPEPPPAPKKPRKGRGRASVPSWDEIMFGGGNGTKD